MLRTNQFPSWVSSLIGRADAVAEIRDLLAHHRLLTLTGIGGSGKTRLAVASAQHLKAVFDERVWLVDLSALADSALVPRAVAAALQVRAEPGVALEATLVAALAAHRTLLVLDNCEHLVAACAGLVELLLHGCEDLHVLATSREHLGVEGERVWAVPALSCPPEVPPTRRLAAPCELLEYAAVQLFVERATAADGGIELDGATLSTVAAICRRLDGVPLAIELAAARVRVLSVAQIALRLDDCLALLSAGSRTAPKRHQTMAATLDWSYRLLSEPERVLLRRLSSFAGGWTLEAAEAICADPPLAAAEMLDLLAGLIDKSLVACGTAHAAIRYRLLEPVRQYASRQLLAAGEQGAVEQRHHAYFAGLIEQAVPHLIGSAQVEWFQRLELEIDNLRAVIQRALAAAEAGHDAQLASVALALPAALERFWLPRGYSDEGASYLRRALALPLASAPGAAVARAGALNAAGMLALFQGSYAEARHMLEQALAIGEAQHDRQTIMVTLRNHGSLAVVERDIDAGVELLKRALALGHEMGAAGRHSVAWIVALLGTAAYLRGDDELAVAQFEASTALLRELGDFNFLALTLRRLGQIALRRGAHARAGALLVESLRLNHDIGSPSGVAACIGGLAGVLLARGYPGEAARLLGVAQALLQETADKLTAADHELLDAIHVRARAWLEGRFDALYGEGLHVRGVEALEYVLSRLKQPRAEAPFPRAAGAAAVEILTPREHEVAALVAQGQSNRAIARALTVEVKTVEAHVTRIHAKLGTASRVQIATAVLATNEP